MNTNYDAVMIGSIASVVVAIIVFVFIGWKVMKLMNEDSKKK